MYTTYMMSIRKKLVYLLFFILKGLILCAIFFLLGAAIFVLHNRSLDVASLEYNDAGTPTILLDDAGNEWARFELDRRDPVAIDQLPQHVLDAFVAAEDWEFFNHSGISWRGIIRSVLVNIYHGCKMQGASTITQQLVKLLFFDNRKTFSRKIKEQICAILIERQFTKKQILETYLNHVYFGCGIYGVQAASHRFWGKNATEITVSQAAVLAGVIRSPGRYCPLLYPLSAQHRRNIVLNSMAKLGFISQALYRDALQEVVDICGQSDACRAPYVKEMVRLFLEEQFGKKAAYMQGFVVKTTINSAAQTAAEQVFKDQYKNLCQQFGPAIDGAMLTLGVTSGEIKALVGGADFSRSKFNRAMQAKRQIGSTIKPLLYAAILQTGFDFTHTEIDEPTTFVQSNGTLWAPHNCDHSFRGKMTLAYALTHSNNIVAIKMLLKIQADAVVKLAEKAGLAGPFHTYPSLALGCIDGTLCEIAGMFNIFANHGTYIQPHCIQWVKNRWGTKLYKHEPISRAVVPVHIVGQVAKVLELGLGRIKKLFSQKWIDAQAISKTGTTNDSRTCWFVGSTPNYTTAAYIGYDDNRPMGKHVYPLRTVFPLWLSFNRSVPQKEKTFVYDPSLQELTIDERSGVSIQTATDGQNVLGTIKIFVQG